MDTPGDLIKCFNLQNNGIIIISSPVLPDDRSAPHKDGASHCNVLGAHPPHFKHGAYGARFRLKEGFHENV